jgi:hypothetical protein
MKVRAYDKLIRKPLPNKEEALESLVLSDGCYLSSSRETLHSYLVRIPVRSSRTHPEDNIYKTGLHKQS